MRVGTVSWRNFRQRLFCILSIDHVSADTIQWQMIMLIHIRLLVYLTHLLRILIVSLFFLFLCSFFYSLSSFHQCLAWWGTRHFVTLMLFMGMANAYVMRTNMSVAIVAMVRQHAPEHLENESHECGDREDTVVSKPWSKSYKLYWYKEANELANCKRFIFTRSAIRLKR